jgi:thiamine transporter
MSNSPAKGARRLVESALMVALGVVLSMLKFIDLPFGGSVTIASMLPILIIAYRHGMAWGTLTGFVYGLFQMLLGLNTFSYVTTWQSVVAVALLDYLVAFLVLGFGGVFKKINSQPVALTAGTIVACVLRYLCHVISGATVWAGLSIPTNAALIYSIGYNATYMIPETLITAILAYYVGSMLDFRSATIDRFSKDNSKKVSLLKIIAGLLVSAALVFDIRQIFIYLQNEDGVFDFSGLSNVNWMPVAIVTAVAIVAAIVLSVFDGKRKQA